MPLTTRVPKKVLATCRAAARQRLAVPVYCPPLVPRGPIGDVKGIADADLFGPIIFSGQRDLYQLSFNNGLIRRRLHWIVGAGRRSTVGRFVIEGVSNEQARPAQLIGVRRVRGLRVSLYRFLEPGGGMHAGHVGAFVSRGPLTTFASIHGADAAAALAMVVAMATHPAYSAATPPRHRHPDLGPALAETIADRLGR